MSNKLLGIWWNKDGTIEYGAPKLFKAVEILKNKSVNLDHLKHSRDYNEYNALCEYHVSISKEEYDLLKEAFK